MGSCNEITSCRWLSLDDDSTINSILLMSWHLSSPILFSFLRSLPSLVPSSSHLASYRHVEWWRIAGLDTVHSNVGRLIGWSSQCGTRKNIWLMWIPYTVLRSGLFLNVFGKIIWQTYITICRKFKYMWTLYKLPFLLIGWRLITCRLWETQWLLFIRLFRHVIVVEPPMFVHMS